MSVVVGIDPGVTGALAAFRDGKLSLIDDLPVINARINGAELAETLRDIVDLDEVWIEETQPMPKNGSIASFSLGYNTGVCVGVIMALEIPFHRVRPPAWKKTNGLTGKDKEAARRLAIELWPGHANSFRRKMDHNRAEACLIARHGLFERNKTHAQGPQAVPRLSGDGVSLIAFPGPR